MLYFNVNIRNVSDNCMMLSDIRVVFNVAIYSMEIVELEMLLIML